MKLKCLVIDDEPLAVNVVKKFIDRVPFLELLDSTCNALEGLEMLRTTAVDLLFLDIEMPDMSGVDLLRQLMETEGNENNIPMVVFTTAYEQYAVEGFELEVLDYLLKPIPFERFLKTANKAFAQRELRESSQKPLPNVDGFIFVKSDYQVKKIVLDDILYIEGLKDYVKIYTKNGMLLSRQNLKGILSKLPSQKFIRIHKSYVVAFEKVDAFQKSGLYINEQRLPIGEYYRDTILKLIGMI